MKHLPLLTFQYRVYVLRLLTEVIGILFAAYGCAAFQTVYTLADLAPESAPLGYSASQSFRKVQH